MPLKLKNSTLNEETGSKNIIKTIILFENGRLGNQLFQLSAAFSVAPDAHLVFIGFHSLLECLSIQNFNTSFFGYKLLKLIFGRLGRECVLSLSGSGKIFSLIKENQVGRRNEVIIEKGICKTIAILDGFFQSNDIISCSNFDRFVLNRNLQSQASVWLKKNVSVPARSIYFIHVRRGDYLSWPRHDAPAFLPSSWYKKCIKKIRIRDPLANFILFSDDISYVQSVFGEFDNLIFSNGSPTEDFVLMTQCLGGGILSASTYAWWAAYYIRQRSAEALFWAPTFWAGWRLGKWFPETIETDWLNYFDVNNLDY